MCMKTENYALYRQKHNVYRRQPKYRAYENMRRRARDCIKKAHVKRKFETSELIGGTFKELAEHLESQFTASMNWDNYGSEWVIDHILPIAIWDLSKSENQLMAFNMHNLQPLTPRENRLKGASCYMSDFDKLVMVTLLFDHAVNSNSKLKYESILQGSR